MADFQIKQADTSPSISYDLTYDDLTKPDLTGATVIFRWKPVDGGTAKQGVAVVDGDGTGVNPARVRYVWVSGDTSVAGSHNAEWEVTFAGGKIGTFPNGPTFISLLITDDLDT